MLVRNQSLLTSAATAQELPTTNRSASLCFLRCLLFIFSLAVSSPGFACTVPVFRYALDRWEADLYRLELPADYAQDAALAAFTRNLAADSPLNLEVAPRPIGDTNALAQLRFPRAETSAAAAVWSGRLDASSLARLTNSPARREIVRRILAGDSAVWVLVESGQRAADDALAARVEKRLKFLESVARLPVIDPNDPTSKLGPGPALRVQFSLLRIPGAPASGPAQPGQAKPNAGPEAGAPNATDETLFLKMLAGPKPAPELAEGAWLAPVFGRGRVLGAWPAADFGDEEIEEACLFLLGACSCQVKRQNPGWDLLLNVNWEAELQAVAAGAAPPVSPASPAANPTAETVTITSPGQIQHDSSANSLPNLKLWLGAAACVVIGLGLLFRRS